MLVVSFAWIAFVELTPASQRPYVGSSTNNTELGLTFDYNGFGRVEGQAGGPGHVCSVGSPRRVRARPRQHAAVERRRRRAAAQRPAPARSRPRRRAPRDRARADAQAILSNGPRTRTRSPSAGRPGRCGCSASASATRPAGCSRSRSSGCSALALLVVGVLLALTERRRRGGASDAAEARDAVDGDGRQARLVAGRRDPRLAALLVLGGWFLVEAAVLSLSKGIVHPYYVSALAPGHGGDGRRGRGRVRRARARGRARIWRPRAGRRARSRATVAAQIVLLHREHYLQWFVPVLIVGAAVGPVRAARAAPPGAPAVALTLVLLLLAPDRLRDHHLAGAGRGHVPGRRPQHDAGAGGYGVNARDLRDRPARCSTT